MEARSAAASGGLSETPPLRRVIGPRLLLLFVVGDILGTGVYALTGAVGGEVGGALWTAFLLSFVVALLTASSYVELVGKYPRAAGAALYVHRAFGLRFLTFIVAFAVMASGLTSASAAARAFGGDYLSEFVELPTVLVAVCFILLLALINLRGVSESVKTNVVLTVVELTGLLIIIAIGVAAVIGGDGEPARLTEFRSGETTLGLITGGAALAFFAFVGFEDSVNMAEEVREPNRAYPRALFGGVVFTGVIYLLVALTSSLLVPVSVLSESTGPLLEVVRVGAPDFPLELFSLFALFAVSNSALINMLMASRLVYGLAHQRIIPRPFGQVLAQRRTPALAIGFITLLALGLVVTGDIADLGGTTSLLLLCVFTVVNVAVLVLRRNPVEHPHFRAPTALPVLGALTAAYLASPLSGRDADQYGTAAILLGVGVVLYAINRAVVGRGADVDPEVLASGPSRE